MNPRLIGIGAALLLLTGCYRSATTKSVLELQGAPDIVAEAAKPNSPWRAFKLRAFQTNQIWGADGYVPMGDKWANYRGKITLWDEDPKEGATALAEIFFRDPGQFDPKNPQRNPKPDEPNDPNDQNAQGTGRGRTYRLHFPASTINGILDTLRFANTDVYLFYYDKQWAIGVNAAEAIGSN